MIEDYDPQVGQGLDRMTGLLGQSQLNLLGDLGHAVDGHLKRALYHLVDSFLSMKLLVNGRTAREIVVRECHRSRVE